MGLFSSSSSSSKTTNNNSTTTANDGSIAVGDGAVLNMLDDGATRAAIESATATAQRAQEYGLELFKAAQSAASAANKQTGELAAAQANAAQAVIAQAAAGDTGTIERIATRAGIALVVGLLAYAYFAK